MLPKKHGFTLAELLIALLILGVIATFTIPKVLQSQQSSQWSSSAKEAASMIVGAYQSYVRDYGKPLAGQDSALPSEYVQYMNYVKVLSANEEVDSYYGQGTRTCGSAQNVCYQLHNGGVLYPTRTDWGICFNAAGTIPYHNVWHFDPDGKVTAGGAANGPGKAVRFILRADGGISTDAFYIGNVCECGACQGATNINRIPPWFSWD